MGNRIKSKKWTDADIRNLQPESKMYQEREGKGFGIRVLPSGHKIWIFTYTFDGKRRQMNLGSYPKMSLAQARADHAAAYAKLHDRQSPRDPQEERDRKHDADRQAREERRLALTMADLVEEYVTKHAKKFKRSWEEDERLLNKEIVAVWGNRKAEDVTKRDITLLLESIVERGTPAMSNQVLKIVRKMFNFAVERDILKHTPCTGVKALAPSIRRERTLSESEIKTFWNNLEHAETSEGMKRALKLVLVTAQRPGEVAGMHTSEIDGHWWTIPSERSKNGREQRVFLTDTALQLIEAQTEWVKLNRELPPPETNYTGFVFPCPHKKKNQAIDAHALPVAVRRNLAWPLSDAKGRPLYQKDGKPATENKMKIEQFTPHDLRRTAATFMASMGFMDEIIDAVLNHVKQGIIRTYNRHGYDKEKQQALEAWERKLNSIITGESAGKVVSIKSGRKVNGKV